MNIIGLVMGLVMVGTAFILTVAWGISEHRYHIKRRDKIQKDIDDIIDSLWKK